MFLITLNQAYAYDAVIVVSFTQLTSEHGNSVFLTDPVLKIGTTVGGSQIINKANPGMAITSLGTYSYPYYYNYTAPNSPKFTNFYELNTGLLTTLTTGRTYYLTITPDLVCTLGGSAGSIGHFSCFGGCIPTVDSNYHVNIGMNQKTRGSACDGLRTSINNPVTAILGATGVYPTQQLQFTTTFVG